MTKAKSTPSQPEDESSRLGFRLYGDFQWPPTLLDGDDDDEEKRRKGVVEIWFLFHEGERRAALRWYPGNDWNRNVVAPGAPPVKDCVFDKDINLEDRFSEDKVTTLWMTEMSPTATKGRKLRFRGGCVFESHDVEKERLELRWPQVRCHTYDDNDVSKKTQHYSELIIGGTKRRHSFRFNLALPTPVPQTSNDRFECPSVLAFSAIYKSSAHSLSECGIVYRLLFGAVGRTNIEPASVAIPSALKNKRLGKAGFSRHSRTSGFYRAIPELDQPKKRRPFENYWPFGNDPKVLECLRLLGFDTEKLEKNGSGAFKVVENPRPEDLSIRFINSGGGTFGLGYRISLKAFGSFSEGPIQIERERFLLETSGHRGESRKLGEVIRADLKLEWTISEEDLEDWVSTAPRADPGYQTDLESRLLWDEDFKIDSTTTGASPTTSYPVQLLRELRSAIKATQEGLLSVSAAQPMSFLPELTVERTQRMLLSLQAHPRPGIEGKTVYGGYPELPALRGTETLYTSFSMQGGELDLNTERALELSMSFPSFESSTASEAGKVKLCGVEDPSWSGSAVAAFRLKALDLEDGMLRFRLGALGFESSKDWLAEGGKAEERPFLILRPRSKFVAETPMAPPVGLELGLRFNLRSVHPQTTDIPRGERERSSAPLLVTEAGGDTSRFILEVEEKTLDAADWHLEATLLDVQGPVSEDGVNAANVSKEKAVYIVLSEEPFSLFRFSRLPLSKSGDSGKGPVASFDSDKRTWVFKRTSEYYHYVLPAQAIGESADKPGRLEIIDLQEGDDDVVRPYPEGDDSRDVRTHLVEYRLTPSAELWIKPSDLQRDYFEPEWAAHDIFRQRGDFGLGVALGAMRGEFLYGLSFSVDPTEESGPSRQARVAEIEALTGRLPRAPQTSDATADRWEVLRKILKARPERLELWTLDSESERPFVPARFESSVRYSLRQTALHRPPVDPPDPEEGQPKLKPGHRMEIAKAPPRYHPQGLPGGALWPLEFWVAFEKLLEDPGSVGGNIENIALSPTGGDADLKASFLNGILSIISEVRGGFVQRQRVEILGRIGAHWHRAKHVVVYERTVNPSAQFAPLPQKGDWHKKRTRRPLLRKVSEYVELLQPMRSYPDTEGASLLASGFLEAIRYNSTIIHVDSAWGSEIAGVGYTIPLWNLLSAKRRPQVYTKPDVAFITRCAGEGEKVTVAQECDDPENIFFFTDLGAKHPDSDRWDTRVGIDGAFAPDPLATDTAEDLSRHRKPSASRYTPGSRRFTWRLLPGGAKTQVNAYRGDRPIYAGLESVTFMRAMPADPEKRRNQENILRGIGMRLSPWEEIDSNSDEAFSEVKTAHQALVATAEELQSNQSDDLLKRAGDQLSDLVRKLEAATKTPKELLNGLDSLKPTGGPDCERLAGDAVFAIQRQRPLILENLSAWHRRGVERLVRNWPPLGGSPQVKRDDLSRGLIESLVHQLGGITAGAYDVAEDIDNGVEQARAAVQSVAVEIQEGLSRAIRRVDLLASAHDDNKPWSPARLESFSRKLDEEWAGLVSEAEAAIEEGVERIALDINRLASGLVLPLERALREAARDLLELESYRGLARGNFGALVAPVRSAWNRMFDANGLVKQLKTKFEEAPEKVKDKYRVEFEKLIGDIRTFGSEAEIGLDRIESIVSATAENAEKNVLDAAKIIGKKAGEIAENINSIQSILQKIVNESSDSSMDELQGLEERIGAQLGIWRGWTIEKASNIGDCIDPAVKALLAHLRLSINKTAKLADELWKDSSLIEWIKKAKKASGLLKESVKPDKLLERAFGTAIDELINKITDDDFDNLEKLKKKIEIALEGIAESVAGIYGAISQLEAIADDNIKEACNLLKSGYDAAFEEIEELKKQIRCKLGNEFNDAEDGIRKFLGENNYVQFLEEVRAAGTILEEGVDAAGAALGNVKAYGRHVIEASANIGKGGAESVPGNLLRLYSAATSAPELAMLEANIDRVRMRFDELSEKIDTTKARAFFARLGDALKSMGLELPFDGLTDTFRIDESTLEKFDLSRFFSNFGGMKLDGLFEGVSIPEGVKDAVRVSHEFDKKQARAWVQIDVNVPVPDRKELFAIGPFAMYFRDSRLNATVRLEASKDSQEISETGEAKIRSSIESVVAGQVMVTLEKARFRYSKESGLKFELEPQNIKLNPVFKFIQDVLSELFPDEIGGLTVIKEKGIPVGLEHDFSMPNLSVSFGTSGVSNIQLRNRFRMLAVPDFILSNRFNLSTPELPFLFSVFIIGGTGYIQVDAEYRPFDKRLSVYVEAAAGGSAALNFAFGPVSGGVFIALSVALSYRKISDQPKGGGLAVSLVLVIAGNVSLWGLVHVYLGLLLRMTYRENGQIDGVGQLKVEVRVSRFFKLKYRTGVTYKLRDGKTTTTRSSSTEIESEELDKIRKKAKRLNGARG